MAQHQVRPALQQSPQGALYINGVEYIEKTNGQSHMLHGGGHKDCINFSITYIYDPDSAPDPETQKQCCDPGSQN